MEKVMIIGCGGAGKSTLARALGEKTGLPVVHLDQIWWSPGNWQHLSKEAFDVRLLEEVRKPRWILDGNFSRTMPVRLESCDTVIYLDFHRLVCFFSWLGRVMKNRGKTRADMGPDCKEWLDPEMAKWVWNFNKQNRKRYHELLSQTDKTVYILKNRRQVKRFLASLHKENT